MEGEELAAVARESGDQLRGCCGDGKSGWSRKVKKHCMNGRSRDSGDERQPSSEKRQQRRMAELERLVGRQQMEIRFLDKALRQVEERRQQKKDAGAVASSKR